MRQMVRDKIRSHNSTNLSRYSVGESDQTGYNDSLKMNNEFTSLGVNHTAENLGGQLIKKTFPIAFREFPMITK